MEFLFYLKCLGYFDADDDFPASATCLYSNNARLFLPMDGLADVGEYCSASCWWLSNFSCEISLAGSFPYQFIFSPGTFGAK
ncbi:MAG: DUF3786 domain-containing protein [Desulfobacteraceae bacterium]|nr:DUF3786 domain-containing protein [Desulfobacteraceae bacterium]